MGCLHQENTFVRAVEDDDTAVHVRTNEFDGGLSLTDTSLGDTVTEMLTSVLNVTLRDYSNL